MMEDGRCVCVRDEELQRDEEDIRSSVLAIGRAKLEEDDATATGKRN